MILGASDIESGILLSDGALNDSKDDRKDGGKDDRENGRVDNREMPGRGWVSCGHESTE